VEEEEEEYRDKYLAAMHKVKDELSADLYTRRCPSIERAVWIDVVHFLYQRISDRADKLNGITRKV
jgi:hypothetical protein